MTRKERVRLAQIRPTIVRAIVALEKKYGEPAVSGAFDRHRRTRALRKKLRRDRADINAQIRKLR